MTEINSHNVKQGLPGSVRTVAEFEALLENLKVQNPARFKADTEDGSFDRFRKTLVDYVAPVVETPKVEAPVEEPVTQADETAKPKLGRPKKDNVAPTV